MTSMPHPRSASQPSSDHERVPLAHGLTAVIIRYGDGEPRPERPAPAAPAAATPTARQQAEYANWLAAQQVASNPAGGTPGGAA